MADARVWGGDSEASINRVNQWMRSQPWYVQQLRAWGQSPSNVNLTSAQRSMLLRLAQQNGVTVDQGAIEVDPAGNFNPKGHKLRNTLIGAGIGAAVAAPFVLPALAGGAGAATGPALLAGAPSGAALPGLLPAIGAGGATAAGATAAAGAGGNYIANAIKGVARQATGGNSGADWVSRLAPLIGLGTTAATGGFSSPRVGMDPTMQQQINDLIGVQTQRAKASQPIYEAAMRLAGSLAPTAQTSSRLQSAIADAGRPQPSGSMDPQVTEALTRLMGRG